MKNVSLFDLIVTSKSSKVPSTSFVKLKKNIDDEVVKSYIVKKKKKKLSNIKKRLLLDRLKTYIKNQEETVKIKDKFQNEKLLSIGNFRAVLLLNFIYLCDLQDEDEKSEILSNALELFHPFGDIEKSELIIINRCDLLENSIKIYEDKFGIVDPTFAAIMVVFHTSDCAQSALFSTRGLILSGQQLHAALLDPANPNMSFLLTYEDVVDSNSIHVGLYDNSAAVFDNDKKSDEATVEVVVENMVSSHDVEGIDADELHELLQDLRSLCCPSEAESLVRLFLQDGRPSCSPPQPPLPDVEPWTLLEFATAAVAGLFIAVLNGLVVAGRPLQLLAAQDSPATVWLRGYFSLEDACDGEELFEAKMELLALAAERWPAAAAPRLQGQLLRMTVISSGPPIDALCEEAPLAVHLLLGDEAAALRALLRLDGLLLGGRRTRCCRRVPTDQAAVQPEDAPPLSEAAGPISVYQQAKAVPKLPRHSLADQAASVPTADAAVDVAVRLMLQSLAACQRRAAEADKIKAKQRLRFVVGLKQVLNGVRGERAKLVVLAPDTEVSDALDDRLGEVLREARERGVPVLFGLSRRKLGKALGACSRLTRLTASQE